MDSVYNVDSLDSVGFIKYNLQELSELVRDSTDQQKSWLRDICEQDVRALIGVEKQSWLHS